MTDGTSTINILETLINALETSISFTMNPQTVNKIYYGRIDTPDHKLMVVDAEVSFPLKITNFQIYIDKNLVYLVGDFRAAKFIQSTSDTFQVKLLWAESGQ